MSGRSRSLDGSCTSVSILGLLVEEHVANYTTVPFLIMGRVTYIHHYVRPLRSRWFR